MRVKTVFTVGRSHTHFVLDNGVEYQVYYVCQKGGEELKVAKIMQDYPGLSILPDMDPEKEIILNLYLALHTANTGLSTLG